MHKETLPRNNAWLLERLEMVWRQYFQDVERKNEISIRFGRRSRTRLGSIAMDGWQGATQHRPYRSRQDNTRGVSLITITGYFQDVTIPEYVIDATIGHELVHYTHGFHSPHPQLYRYPHQGGIVDKEMVRRGMGEILKQQKAWLKKEWQTIITSRSIRRRKAHGIKLRILRPYW